MRERFQRATAVMKQAGVDLLLLTPGADLFYLTGFEHGHAAERLLALALRADGSATWIAPAMNVPQVEEHAVAGEVVRGWSDTQWYLPALVEAVKDARTIAFDDEARSAFMLDLLGVAPKSRVVGSGTIMRSLRLRKDAAELALLRKAAAQVDRTIPLAAAMCRPGHTESQIDRELREALQAADPVSAIAFTIIASGSNAALPHHETGNRKMEAGDVVIIDFGTRVPMSVQGRHGAQLSRLYGYHSDITITCSVGNPKDREVSTVYKTVFEAQRAAINAVRPGARCEEIDNAARSVIESAGYGPQFLHRTGHGLGLQVHEAPYLKSGNAELLEPGMVFSIEPGIYLPGRFGVRLEVIVSVGEAGCDPINAPSSPEILVGK
ncbi:MAG TPA: Xaa-Pro peptidase family protein [Humisphaera sp.]|jgi:Xaa-Pro dipeptidase|nr:Xaa-Pro peptidase family protein [Humisphaera sp.]